METKLEQLLEEYLHLVESKYKETLILKRKGILKLYSNKENEFNELVNHMEKQFIFVELINETYKFLDYGHYFEKKGSIIDLSFDDLRRKIINYFRRSGCYYSIYTNEFDYCDYTSQKYIDALTRKEKNQYYLAPMEYVGFAEHLMDFGQFKIQKYTAGELDVILNNKINKIFFQRAYLKLEQLKELEDYWFIYFTKKSPLHGYRGHALKIESDQNVTHTDIEFVQFPTEILPFIKILSIFDWQADWVKKIKREIDSIETSAIKYKIPFVFVIDDDLLETPKDAPELSILNTEIVTFTEAINIWDNNEQDIIEDIKIHVDEVPERNIIFDKSETNSFKIFINRINKDYSSIRISHNSWDFIELSLNFFIKGFFSNGLEQLLWYITSIESLLGGKEGGLERKGKNGISKSEGIEERLSRRISLILGKGSKHKKEIRESFKELYKFRCDLVHGNKFGEKALIQHLITVRDLSRKTIIWFINNLKQIQDKIDSGETNRILNREDILSSIDLNLIR